MTGPIKALSWEFARRLTATVPLILGILLLGPLSVEGLFRVAGLSMDDAELPPLSWHCVYLSLGFLLMATPLVEAFKGVHQRVFTLPVSNRFLTTWTMTLAATAVVGQELIVHGLYRFLLADWSIRAIFGTGESLIDPCQPVFATMISLLVAMYWSLKRFSFRKLLVCGVSAGCLTIWFASHYYPNGLQGGPRAWIQFSIFDTVICTAVIAGSWVVSLRGIESERCGDNVGHSLEKRVEQLLTRVRPVFFRDRVAEHRSAEFAIAWNQWRHCGRNAALAAGIGFGTILAFLVFNVVGSRKGLEGIVVLLFIIPGVLGFMTGSVLGILAPPSGRERITTFLASVPVSDSRLARGLLMNAWRTTLAGWTLAIVIGMLSLTAAAVYYGMDSLFEEIDRFHQMSRMPFGALIIPMAVLASGVLAWMLTATFAVLHWTGRQLLPLFTVVAIMSAVILLMVMSFFLEPATMTRLREVSMSVAAVAILAGSLWAFVVAVRRKLLKPGFAILLLSLWGGQSLLCWLLIPAPALHRFMVAGVLLLSVSPIAFAPLAVSGNRHVA